MAAPRLHYLRVFITTVAWMCLVIEAADPDPLQDFCIADLTQGPIVNGYLCKTNGITADDFFFSALSQPANLTGNPLNGSATFGFVQDWPALNTLGLSLVRLDMEPGGVISPHTHNLATEILYGLEGEIYTGFVTNNNQLFAKVVRKGEAFIFPRGLLHFQLNVGTTHASSINVLNSQNPGLQLMNLALFGSGIKPEILAKAFFMSETEVTTLEAIISQYA